MGKTVYILIVLLAMLAGFASAATISGTIYDLNLNRAKNVLVQINTVPSQRFLAINGTYSFIVAPGTYTLSAVQANNNATEYMDVQKIVVNSEGSFVDDLFLFPSTEEEEELFNSTDFDFSGTELPAQGRISYVFYIVAIMAIVALAILLSFAFRKKTSPQKEDGDVETIISIIKKQGGRTTQKEIRKEMPHSEAKVSLMIAELESKGVIEKIKKGRGNIIILK
jgi:uncharacterized membrane protein